MQNPRDLLEPPATSATWVTVRWEPCPEFHDDPDAVDGRCAGCGWAPDDHDRDEPAPLAA